MRFFKKRINAEDFGASLVWEIGKYANGAESALGVLLDDFDYTNYGPSTLTKYGVSSGDRKRFQIFFTIFAVELGLQSTHDKKANYVRVGFLNELPKFCEWLEKELGLSGSSGINPSHLSADLAQMINSNHLFKETGDFVLYEEDFSIKEGIFVEFAKFSLDEAIVDNEIIKRNFEDLDKRKFFTSRLTVTMSTAMNYGALIWRESRLT